MAATKSGYGGKIALIVERVAKPQWIGSAGAIGVHRRAFARICGVMAQTQKENRCAITPVT
ncbi:MAG TPA: hypothetical protein VMB34_20920 [Acetobacteraceae bacterium]|nr:hypothetical protein [Acetobacteraceae bacterium]